MNRQTDELTGLTSIVVMDSKQRGSGGKELSPMVKLIDEEGKDLFLPGTHLPAHYFLPINAIIKLRRWCGCGSG